MAYNKVVLNGKTLIDLTEDTVNKKVLGADYTAHNAAGDTITGNLVLSPENISSNISIDLLPPEDTTRAWIPIGQEYDTLRQQAIPHRTMTVTLPTINGTDNPSLSAYAPAHPDDINQCLGYGIVRKYESNYAKLGIVQINQDGTTKVLLNNYNMFNSSNSYIGSIESVVDTPEYIYILTGYDSSTSSYRDYNYLWYFNKNTNTITRISSYILTKQYSQSFSLYTLGNAVYVFGRHNASSSSSTHSSWYYKIFKTIIGSSTVSTIYSLNRYILPSIFIYKDLFYTTLADDSNNTSQYAIFDENGTIVDHWQTGNGITGVPQVIYNDWFIYLTYKSVYSENGMGSYSTSIYYYYGCNYNTREIKWVASGLTSFTTGNATILNNEIVGRSSKTFYFYPLIPQQLNENVLTLIPRNDVPLITYNENTQQFVKGANIYDAYFISTAGEVKTCGVYCYTNNLWSPLNAATHTPVARFKMNNQLEYCDNNITWGDYINTKYNVNDYILDEDSGYIKLNDNIVCEKTAVGCQSVASTEQIKPEGKYVTYQGSLDTYTIDLRLSNVTTASPIRAISRADTLTLTFTADSNYELPTSIVVNNANYTWDAETGILQIGSPFDDVEVIITTEKQIEHSGVLPKGAIYYRGVTSTTPGSYTGATNTYREGDTYPGIILDGDVYVYGGYEYRYNQYYGSTNNTWTNDTAQLGWGVRVLDTSLTNYQTVLNRINGSSITSLTGTFYNCSALLVAPILPPNVKYLGYSFYGCSALTTAPDLTHCTQVTNMKCMFDRCAALITYMGNKDGNGNFVNYYIPITVINMQSTFSGCVLITAAPNLINCLALTSMEGTFYECAALVDVTKLNIPANVINISYTFYKCISLSGTIIINITPTTYTKCLYNTQVTSIEGNCNNKSAILATK